MKRIVTLALAGIVLFLLAGPVAAQTADFKIIVNKANPVRGLAKAKIGLMFMKMTTKWEDGATVEPVDLPLDSPTRAAFSTAVHGRETDTIVTIWQRAVFSGRGEPPPQKASDAEVIAFVASRPGALGYVSAAAATDTVKVIDILKSR